MPADLGELIVAEPAGRYAARPPLVVDCSVFAAMLFHESRGDQARFVTARKDWFAPDLLDYEMASVAVKKSAQLPKELVVRALNRFARLRITRCRVNAGKQFELALRFGITAYDAAYLAVAMELNAPLATFDAKLGAAARALLG